MPPKFKVGDSVVLRQSRRENVPGGVCIVTKVSPRSERWARVSRPERLRGARTHGKWKWTEAGL